MPRLLRLRPVLYLAVIALTATAAHATSNAGGATYYVSPSGSDANPGSAAAPWRTVDRVNRASLAPGDTVLFQGGATFGDATLVPPSSGTSGSPVTFGSYGSGQATINNSNGAVWLPSGLHDVAFTNLSLSASGAIVFASAGSGSGSSGIVLERSTVHDSPYAGLVAQPQDSNWTISGNTFRHLGDSGLIVQGAQITIDDNTITDTGWNTSLNYGKHGIYAKGPSVTISGNDISSNANGSAVSLRYGGATVTGNTIHDTNYAVSLFPQDPKNTGLDAIYHNRMWNITGFAFYYAGTTDTGQAAGINVLWTSNTTQLANASEAVNVSEIKAARVEIANSIFTGSFGSAYRGCGTCVEHNNDWYGGSSNLPSGPGDQHVSPGLSAPPALTPSAASPVVDAGTTSTSYASYSASCDGAMLHYCLARPDQGAVEYLTSAAPAPTPAPAPTTTTTTTTTPATAPTPSPAPREPAPAPSPAPTTTQSSTPAQTPAPASPAQDTDTLDPAIAAAVRSSAAHPSTTAKKPKPTPKKHAVRKTESVKRKPAHGSGGRSAPRARAAWRGRT